VGTTEYEGPVDTLVHLGETGLWEEDRQDYRKLGLTSEHIPQLLAVLQDERFWSLTGDEPELFAPHHAARALVQLHPPIEALESLLRTLAQHDDDDWVLSDYPRLLAAFGPDAIPRLAAFALDESGNAYARSTATDALAEIAQAYPETRECCLQAITAVLENYRDNAPELNAFLMLSLLVMKAVEALPLITEVFAADAVDQWIVDWAFITRQLGVHLPDPTSGVDWRQAPLQPGRTGGRSDRKKKAKRNQAKKSRRRNR